VIIKDPSHLHNVMKRNCMENSDNRKEMSWLSINLNFV